MNIIKKDRFIKIINVIIILLFILHIIASIIEIVESKQSLIPTGNVDIFDVNCECQNNKDDKPVFNEENGVLVYDNNDYFGQRKLRIFENPAYEYQNLIAPGSSNSYQFIIRNNNDFEVNIQFNTTEINKYNINLKFRLKENNKYIIGDSQNWVTSKNLNYSNINIAAANYNTYTLDWKWEFNENEYQNKHDTAIGFEAQENYSLLINIKAKKNGE